MPFRSDWFSQLTGFADDSPATVRRLLQIEGEELVSTVTGRRMGTGRLTTPSLAELRAAPVDLGRPSQVSEVVGDVTALHRDPVNAGAVFQVASQFNLLEMVGPGVAPEDGIARYAHDRTQGPACAMCCGAGTVFRNYFVPVGDGIGQERTRQLDMAADLHAALGGDLWDMRNGYLLPTAEALAEAGRRIAGQEDALRGTLRVGVQAQAEVTLGEAGHAVTQVYCSAAPVAYGRPRPDDWAPLAQLILDAAYEATLHVALQAGQPVFLTQLGGGAFGNRPEWIAQAMERAVGIFARAGLDIRLVSYGRPSGMIDRLRAAL